MVEEIYQIKYVADVDQAKANIRSLAEPLAVVASMSEVTIDGLKQVASAFKGSSLGGLSKSIGDLKSGEATLDKLWGSMANLAQWTTEAKTEVGALVGIFKGLKDVPTDVGKLASRVQWLGENAATARGNVAGVSSELGKLNAKNADLNTLRDSMQGFQRKAYGAAKNVQDIGSNLGSLESKSAGLGSLRDQAGGIGKQMGTARSKTLGLGRAIGGLAARITVLQGLKQALEDVGRSFDSARDKASAGGKSNLNLRRRYRELGNLQGKSSPDNEVVGGALRYRIATGYTDDQANDALRRFEGGLPAALARGNISGNSTSGLAGDLFRETSVTGNRVGISGGTTGLLTAKLAQTSKIESVDQGVSKFGAIIDTLNRGDGDLTPLVNAVVQGSGGMIGDGQRFKDLGEFAAAESVASLNATPKQAATRIRQAVTALNRPEATEALGVKPGDDFPTAVGRLGKVVDGVTNKDQALMDAGFGNQAERRALLNFYTNKDILATEYKEVRKGSDPAVQRASNRAFMATDDAQNQVSDAEGDAAKFYQFAKQESVEVSRKKAENTLRKRGQMDTTEYENLDAAGDNVVTRGLSAGLIYMTGRKPNQDELPIFLGGKPTRERRIDAEAEKQSAASARLKGIDPNQRIQSQFGGIDVPPEDRIGNINQATRDSGGSPYAAAGSTDSLMRELIRETQRTNQILQQGAKPAPNFLPVRPLDDGGRNGPLPLLNWNGGGFGA